MCQLLFCPFYILKYYLLSVVSLLQQTSRRIELIKDLNAFVSGELKWAVTFFLFSTFVHILKHFFFLLELIAYKAKWHRNLNEPKIIIIENWYQLIGFFLDMVIIFEFVSSCRFSKKFTLYFIFSCQGKLEKRGKGWWKKGQGWGRSRNTGR